MQQKEQHVQMLRGRAILVPSNLQVQGLTWGKEACQEQWKLRRGAERKQRPIIRAGTPLSIPLMPRYYKGMEGALTGARAHLCLCESLRVRKVSVS